MITYISSLVLKTFYSFCLSADSFWVSDQNKIAEAVGKNRCYTVCDIHCCPQSFLRWTNWPQITYHDGKAKYQLAQSGCKPEYPEVKAVSGPWPLQNWLQFGHWTPCAWKRFGPWHKHQRGRVVPTKEPDTKVYSDSGCGSRGPHQRKQPSARQKRIWPKAVLLRNVNIGKCSAWRNYSPQRNLWTTMTPTNLSSWFMIHHSLCSVNTY